MLGVLFTFWEQKMREEEVKIMRRNSKGQQSKHFLVKYSLFPRGLKTPRRCNLPIKSTLHLICSLFDAFDL